jgi:hypothetical protein
MMLLLQFPQNYVIVVVATAAGTVDGLHVPLLLVIQRQRCRRNDKSKPADNNKSRT